MIYIVSGDRQQQFKSFWMCSIDRPPRPLAALSRCAAAPEEPFGER